MSEENTEKSTWDELVGELGVNVTDDVLERRQPAPKELPKSRREKADREEEASAAPSDWEGLASSLGVEVPPPVEQPPVQKSVTSKAEKPARKPPRAERKPRVEETVVEVKVESDRVDSSEFVEQLDEEEAEEELPRISGEAARSAFDALFAADAASWGSAFVSPRTNVESSFLFTEGEEAVFTEDIPEDAAGEGDEEEEPKRGRRRRRRGGRGRGRGAKSAAEENENQDSEESEQPVGEESSDAESSEVDSGEVPEKRRRRRRPRGRSRSKDDQDVSSEEEDSRIKKHVASHVGDEEDDDDDDDLSYDDDDDGPSAGGGRSSHRNLPTWDEAIGVIVDGNLAQRSKSPANSSSGSPSSRGRSRGGRRHKKS